MTANRLKHFCFISFIICGILGTMLHFAYDISNSNYIIGIFCPVNESIWEHFKLIFIPLVIFSIISYIIPKYRKQNIFLASALASIVAMFSIYILHLISIALNISSIVYDITTYYIALAIAFVTIYFFCSSINLLEATENSMIIGIVALIFMLVLFVFYTIAPPHFSLTLDPITKTYGIYKTQ